MAEIAGLKLIVPSSVAGSGVSVSASGKVTFTAATSVSVNGCFSSTYDNYLVVFSGVNADTSDTRRLRLRASGTDASGSNYVWQQLFAESTIVGGSRFTQDNMAITYLGSDANGFHLYVYGPALAQPTAARSVTVHTNGGDVKIVDIAATHSLSTAYDGFTLYGNDGATGSLTVYGLSQ